MDPSRSSTVQSAVYRSRHPVALCGVVPASSIYTLVLHRGELEATALAKLQAEYVAERPMPWAPRRTDRRRCEGCARLPAVSRTHTC